MCLGLKRVWGCLRICRRSDVTCVPACLSQSLQEEEESAARCVERLGPVLAARVAAVEFLRRPASLTDDSVLIRAEWPPSPTPLLLSSLPPVCVSQCLEDF